ncbi:MAG: hypothetical protein VKL42_12440 [Snowella sp.]|nr:hypothetical protein [Snowella sp.]
MPKYLVTCERLVTVCVEVEADSLQEAIAKYHRGELEEDFEAITDTKPPKATLIDEKVYYKC